VRLCRCPNSIGDCYSSRHFGRDNFASLDLGVRLCRCPNSIGDCYTYSYDVAGRLTSVDNTGTPNALSVLLSYGYDTANNLISVTDSINGQQKGTTAYSYDILNRATQITQSGNGVAAKRINMAYNKASQSTQIARYSDLNGNALVAQSDYTYGPSGRLVDLTHQSNSTTYAAYQWVYDSHNRITQFTSPDGTNIYTYNSRDELTGTDSNYQTDEAYSYDASGNRTNAGYQTGTNNRLLSDGTYSYTYDNEGNRTSRTNIATGEVTSYSWDYHNRLTGVTIKDINGTLIKAVGYTYDVYNQRISKSVDSEGTGAAAPQTELYAYEGSNISLVFDGQGNQTHRYLYGTGVDQILADETQTGVNWALVDNLGSVRDILDNNGTLLNHITYDSFGQVSAQTNAAIDFRYGYTGREQDRQTGLDYYRARYYDAATGGFLSEDPMGFAAGDYNLSRYVFASPTNFTDPSGLETGLLEKVAEGAEKVVVGASDAARKTAPIALKGLKFGGKYLNPAGRVISTVKDYLIDTEPMTDDKTIAKIRKKNGNPQPTTIPTPSPTPSPSPSPAPSPQPQNNPNCENDNKPKECSQKGGRKHNLGGSHGMVRRSNIGGEAHHMPSWGAIQRSGITLSYTRAPAICMTVKDHLDTMSHGGGDVPDLYRTIIPGIIRTNFYDAQLEDVIELRNNPRIGNKYDEGIRQMQSYTLNLMATRPDLF
jgi:RHS repeat-associated protein